MNQVHSFRDKRPAGNRLVYIIGTPWRNNGVTKEDC